MDTDTAEGGAVGQYRGIRCMSVVESSDTHPIQEGSERRTAAGNENECGEEADEAREGLTRPQALTRLRRSVLQQSGIARIVARRYRWQLAARILRSCRAGG